MVSQIIIPFLILLFIPRATPNPYKTRENVHALLTPDEREKIFGEPFLQSVPDYHVTHPVQVDESANFLTYDLSNGNRRKRRDLAGAEKEPLYFHLSAFGQNYHLNVTLNDELLSPNFVVEIRGNQSSRFHLDVEHCYYTGQVISSKGLGTRVAVSNCDGLRGLIRTPEDVFTINPLPNRLGLDKNKTRAHVVHRRSTTHLEDVGKALRAEKRSENWCGVQDETGSRKKRAVFDPPAPVDYSQDFTIETLVVVDKKMTDFHGIEELKVYVPSLINIVYNLLGDTSIGANVKYVLQKLLILEHDQEGLVISPHAGNTMTSFCEWTKRQNIQDDNNPDHFDHAALISRYDFCRNSDHKESQNCEKVLGLAQVEGMCSLTGSCTLSKDGGLGTAYTIAHETGHNLGAQHDSAGNSCADIKNIMSTQASGKETAFEWSSCSRQSIHAFLSGDHAQCLQDKPQKAVKLPQRLPGELYNADDQCRRTYGDKSRECPAPFVKAKVCIQLWCVKPENGMCATLREPAAEGTECGHQMWCRRGKCVPHGSEGPEAIDGGYGPWGEWSDCSHSCGGGLITRQRKCDNPQPKNGGKLCMEHSEEFKFCHTPKCPAGTPSPRAEQCESKQQMRFIDGNKYQWVYNPAIPIPAGQQCKLSCIAEVGIRQFAKYSFGFVAGGTRCDDYDENSGLCINGKCQPLGCDKVFGSSQKFDRCGVCDGDGTTCIGKRLTYKGLPNPIKGHYQSIALIPKGARNIQIKEISGFKNYLALMTVAGEDLLNMDFRIKPRSFAFVGAGTRFKYLRDENRRERITAKGPLNQDVELLYLVQSWKEEYQVRIRFLVPRPKEAKDEDTRIERSLEEDKVTFHWIRRSLGCSESCGGGIEVRRPTCVRTDDRSIVSDHYCQGEKPGEENSECNTQKCPARWKTGEWSDCSKTCNDGNSGERTREIMCIDESHEIETEDSESYCQGPKPATRETCAIQPCPAEWVTVSSSPCSAFCGQGLRMIEVNCVKTTLSNKKVKVTDEECTDPKPPTTASCDSGIPCQ